LVRETEEEKIANAEKRDEKNSYIMIFTICKNKVDLINEGRDVFIICKVE